LDRPFPWFFPAYPTIGQRKGEWDGAAIIETNGEHFRPIRPYPTLAILKTGQFHGFFARLLFN
jgi:hypothetical protein